MEASNRTAEQLSEGLIEAGWLVALAVVPLFFNPFTNRSFEPDKIAVLRVVVLVMTGAWLVKIVFAGRSFRDRWRGLHQWGILLPVAAVIACAAVSSGLSVDPRLSWWGSYLRGQGTLTLVCYTSVFLLAGGHLRRADQWRRVVFVVVLTSVPVSLYALMQGVGTDPLAWSESSLRSSSTLGNPVFLGGYLLMAVFVTARELADSVGGLVGAPAAAAPHHRSVGVLRCGLLLFIVSCQLIAMIRSGSRGPVLGLAAGLFVLGLLSAVQLRAAAGCDHDLPAWRRVVARWSWLAVVAAGLCTVILLQSTTRSATQARPGPGASRLARAVDLDSRSAQVRINLWAAVLDMMESDEPLPLQPDVTDPLLPARRLVGYGPETLSLSLNRFLPEELIRLEKRGSMPDRAHNAVLDQLATTGLLGLVCWLWLWGEILLWGVRGMLPGLTTHHRVLFWMTAGGSVAAAVAVLRAATGSWLWTGLAAPAGLVIGAIAFAALALSVAGLRGDAGMATGARAVISVVAIATLSAHLVETSFSFATAATSLYFWFFAAVAVASGLGRLRFEDDDQPNPPGISDAPPAAVITAIICCTVLFDLATATGGEPGSGGAWKLLALTWIAALMLTATTDPGWGRPHSARPFLVFAAASVIPTLVFAALLKFRLAATPGDASSAVPEPISRLAVQYTWAVLIATAALALAIAVGWRWLEGRKRRVAAAALAGVLVTSGLAAPRVLRTARADVFAKYAGAALDRDRPAGALDLALRAVALAPLEDAFLSLAGRAAIAAATAETDSTRRTAALKTGEAILARAVAVRPLNPDHVANLARLRVVMADREFLPDRRSWLEEQAGAGFERALQLRPGSAEYLAGLGGMLLRRGELERAAPALEEAVRRDHRYVPASLVLAQCYLAMAEKAAAAGAEDRAAGHRLEAERVLELALQSNPDSVPLRSALATGDGD